MRAILKTLGAGATIFAIGAAMTVLTPKGDEPVREARADIGAFSFAPRSQLQRFTHTLKNEGMEEPRAYDHNGNKMFFSTTTTEESPLKVLERFQRGFVENGVNESVHLSPFADVDAERLTAARRNNDRAELRRQKAKNEVRGSQLTDYVGGMVPVMVDSTRVIMVGASTAGRADTYSEWISEIVSKRKDRPKDAAPDPTMGIDAMRYVEAFTEGRRTRIIAVWSDEDYQAGKLADRGEDLNVDPGLPSCPGCERLYNVEGETESNYSTAAYAAAGNSVEQVVGFYDRVLVNKGWQLSPTARVIDAVEAKGMKKRTDGKLLQYARGSEFLTLVAWPTDRGATVHLAKSN